MGHSWDDRNRDIGGKDHELQQLLYSVSVWNVQTDIVRLKDFDRTSIGTRWDRELSGLMELYCLIL